MNMYPQKSFAQKVADFSGRKVYAYVNRTTFNKNYLKPTSYGEGNNTYSYHKSNGETVNRKGRIKNGFSTFTRINKYY